MNPYRPHIPFLLLLLSSLVTVAFSQEPVTKPHYFNMTVYVFEGLRENIKSDEPTMPDIVHQSLEKISAMRQYQDYRSVDQISWLVKVEGDMDRFLDIPERWWALAEDTNISFQLIYNFAERYLTLHDFRFMIRQVPKLKTSVGLADGGAAILGHSRVEARSNEIFFIVTLQVQDKLFSGQSDQSRFTVVNLVHDHH